MVPFAFLGLCAEHLGAEHRHKGEGGGSGHDHDDGHDPAELLEHDAGHTGNHGQGQEHAEHRQGGRHYGDCHLGSAVHGCLLGFLAPFKMAGDVLEHHNRIVHDHTDGNRKRRHRYDVEGVAGCKQIDERSQERNRNRKHDDESGPPSSEEEVHHEHNHQKRDDDGLDEGVDGVDDVLRTVDDDIELHIGRKRRLNLGELLLHALDHIDGVGAGLFLDGNLRTPDAHCIGHLGPLGLAVDNGGDVTQIYEVASGHAHNHIKQFARVGKLLLHTH